MDELSNRSAQALLAGLLIIAFVDAVTRGAGMYRIYQCKSSDGVSGLKYLLYIASSLYGVGAELIGTDLTAGFRIVWGAAIGQTAVGVVCNILLFAVIAYYASGSIKGINKASLPDASGKRRFTWAPATWLMLYVYVTVVCVGIGLTLYLFGTFFSDFLARYTSTDHILPFLSLGFAVTSVVLSIFGALVQVHRTATSDQPQTQHCLLAITPAIAPFFVAAIQLATGVSWAVWLPSLAPAIPEGANVLVLFYQMRNRPEDIVMEFRDVDVEVQEMQVIGDDDSSEDFTQPRVE